MRKAPQKLGRPPKSAADRRDATPLYIKLTAEERALIDEAGAPQPSVWVRELALRAAKRQVS